jgi:hypothetical protein
MMFFQEKTAPNPFLIFPSRTRKYVRLTPKQAYDSVIHLMRENLGAESIESEQTETPYVKARIGGAFGVTVDFQVFPEGGVSALEIRFGYRTFLILVSIVLIAAVGLSLILGTWIPGIGTALIFPLAYKVNFTALRFLDALNEALPHLEQEYARRTLIEERKRWQIEPKDTDALYRRLCEKYIKTWGNTNVLDYKIAEYESQGLTHNEAIRKTAEEEGIY